MNRQKSIVKISLLGIAVNAILVVFKMIVGLLANSIAIILDAVNDIRDRLKEKYPMYNFSIIVDIDFSD